MNGKVLEFFTKIPKLEADRSNWVIFKDHFLFVAAAAFLSAHIDGTGAESTLSTGFLVSSILLESQRKELDKFTLDLAHY
jgi:hypothetical protein